jgi:receptor expression-enhancing protein 1/2/3/4
MYWTTLSLFLVVESQFYFILYWVPFYAWMRLALHLYLVMPGKQGSVYIYQAYIHPWLESHERQIDDLIHEVHAKGKAAGFDAIQSAIEYIRVNFLGQVPHQPPPPQAQGLSYSASLLNRFCRIYRHLLCARQDGAASHLPNIYNPRRPGGRSHPDRQPHSSLTLWR